MIFLVNALLTLALLAAPSSSWAMRAPVNALALEGKTVGSQRVYCASSYEKNSETSLKPINQLQVGDEVLAWSEWKERGTNASADQRLSYENVTDVFTTSERLRTLVHLSLDNGQTLSATDGHPFFTQDGWRDAIMLKKGGKLLLKGEDSDAAERWAQITDIRTEQESVTTYNLEVANAHTFFVGVDGVLVHNARGCANPVVREAIDAGKRAHKAYKDVLGHIEETLKNGKRPDSVDRVNNIVRELKPDTASGIKKGTEQLKGYVDQLQKETGQPWQGFLDLYRAKR